MRDELEKLLDKYNSSVSSIKQELQAYEELAKKYVDNKEWHSAELARGELCHLERERIRLEEIREDLISLMGQERNFEHYETELRFSVETFEDLYDLFEKHSKTYYDLADWERTAAVLDWLLSDYEG